MSRPVMCKAYSWWKLRKIETVLAVAAVRHNYDYYAGIDEAARGKKITNTRRGVEGEK